MLRRRFFVYVVTTVNRVENLLFSIRLKNKEGERGEKAAAATRQQRNMKLFFSLQKRNFTTITIIVTTVPLASPPRLLPLSSWAGQRATSALRDGSGGGWGERRGTTLAGRQTQQNEGGGKKTAAGTNLAIAPREPGESAG